MLSNIRANKSMIGRFFKKKMVNFFAIFLLDCAKPKIVRFDRILTQKSVRCAAKFFLQGKFKLTKFIYFLENFIISTVSELELKITLLGVYASFECLSYTQIIWMKRNNIWDFHSTSHFICSTDWFNLIKRFSFQWT